MKSVSLIGWFALLSVVFSIFCFTLIMTRGPVITGGPPVEIYISLISLALALILSIIGIIKKSEPNLLPGISLVITIAFAFFFLLIYIVSGMSTDY